MAEALGHCVDDAAGEFEVFGAGPVELLAVAVLVLAAVWHDAEDFGVLLGEPCGRGGAGGAEDDGDVVFGGEAMAWSIQSKL